MRACRALSGVLVVGLACCLSGCADGTTTSSTDAGAGSGKQQVVDDAQKQLALDAKDELFKRLSSRLMEVMSTDGATAAIRVCSEEALEITEQVGQAKGVRIGRTSFRLRNRKNTPPSWAAGLIQQRVAEPQFINLPNDQLGALLPIRLQPQCLLCHGAPENIPDEVQQELAKSYPDDQAKGFDVDDLRGWFWVEVPQ
jgi:hypothetical protein